MGSATWIGICLIVITGAALQRVAGMGLGMLAGPGLALLVGPIEGVTMSNSAALVTSTLILIAMRENVDWERYARLAPLMILGTLIGALFVKSVDVRLLDIVIGVAVLGSLASAIRMSEVERPELPGARVATGIFAGFSSAVAGMSAPMLTAYAVAVRWQQTSFAATLQPIFLTVNASTLLAKATVGPGIDIALIPWLSVLLIAALGVALGRCLVARVSVANARRVAITLAASAGLATLIRGFVGF